MNLTRTKPVEQSIQDTDEPGHKLRRSCRRSTSRSSASASSSAPASSSSPARRPAYEAGPAVAISFVVAGIACALAALCYAEFASTVPVAGSAYTFSYATLGELVAWIIGWDLILELALGGATVVVGLVDVLRRPRSTQAGITLPGVGLQRRAINLAARADRRWCSPACICLGIKHLGAGQPGDRRDQGRRRAAGHRRRAVLRQAQQLLAVHPAGRARRAPRRSRLGPVAAAGPRALDPADRSASPASSPPPRWCSSRSSASTSSRPPPRRRKNPQRDLPRGILGSLAICTILYVAVIARRDRHGEVRPRCSVGRRRWPRRSGSVGKPTDRRRSSRSARWPA